MAHDPYATDPTNPTGTSPYAISGMQAGGEVEVDWSAIRAAVAKAAWPKPGLVDEAMASIRAALGSTGKGETVPDDGVAVAADAILDNIRDRRLLKWIFAENADENPVAIGYVDGPIDLATQRECVETWARLALDASPKPTTVEASGMVERLTTAIREIQDCPDNLVPLVTVQRMRNIAGFALLGGDNER